MPARLRPFPIAVATGVAIAIGAIVRLAATRNDLWLASPGLRMLATAVALGGSYPLVHYGPEARGYALAIAFALSPCSWSSVTA